VIDNIPDDVARVPDRFRERQWARLPAGQTDENFVRQVQRLLTGESVSGRTGIPFSPTASKRARKGPWIAALIFALAAGSAWFALRMPPTALPPVAGSKSIAVLPFTNMSESKDNAYFADGVQEDILTSLASIGDLEVISRTSVMGYRDTKKTMQQIGRELGVSFLLEGSVRRIGNKVRVTGQLIDTRTDQHLWAKAYDRELDDVFAIQAALAKEIATALHSALSPQDLARLDTRPTDNVIAYDSFLQGREAMRSGGHTMEMLGRAQPYFERAVQLDPRFALAWAELARLHLNTHDYLDRTPARLAQAKRAIDAAVQLAPDEADVIIALAQYRQATGDQADHAAQMQRLIRLFPNDPRTLLMQAWEARDPREALRYYQQARRLDPRNELLLSALGDLYLFGRHFDEALALASEANALLPANTLSAAHAAFIPFLARGETGPMESFLAQISVEARHNDADAIMALANWAYTVGDAAGLVRLWEESGGHWRFAPATARLDRIVIAQALIILGQRERALPLLVQNRDLLVAALATETDSYRKWADLALIYALLGNQPEAKTAENKARQLAPWLDFATLHAWSGEKEAALAELKRTIPSSGNFLESNVHVLRHQIGYWPLQGDPRFESILNDPKNNAPLF
jgi:TolB-like protein/Tfp pilus assembly protein PilF